MTLAAAALIEPRGPILADFFPAEGKIALRERVDAYLLAAYEHKLVVAIVDEDAKDAAAKLYALYLTYDAVYSRMISRPASLTATDKGSHLYTDEQRAAMKEKRDEALAAFDDLVAEDTVTPRTTPQGPLRNIFTT